MGRRLRASTSAADSRAPGRVARRRPEPEAWRHAVRLVEEQDGDRRRLDVLDDGAVVIRNRPVRP